VSIPTISSYTNLGHYNLPNPLVEYLYHGHPQVIRDLSTLSISIGPYDSYYAHDKSSASWANLPPVLEKAILQRLVSQDAWKTVWKENGSEAPSFVSLGADGSFFMRTVCGGGSWDLKDKSEGMVGTNKFLDESPNFLGIAVSGSKIVRHEHLFTSMPGSLSLSPQPYFLHSPPYIWKGLLKPS
jgi:hypothetical protein